MDVKFKTRLLTPVADPGFPRGALTAERAPTYYLANFVQKLHEDEEILGRGGVGRTRLSCPAISSTGHTILFQIIKIAALHFV